MKKVIAIALMLATSASAEFTTAEKTEAAKVIFARAEFAAALVKMADSVRDYSNESNRQDHADVLASAVDAIVACHDAQKWLQGSTPASFHPGTFVEAPRLPDIPRPQIVAQAIAFVAECGTKGDFFAQGLIDLGNLIGNPQIVTNGNRILSVVKLETFNGGLAFADPYPPSAPRVVGPHGDFEEGEHNLEAMDLKVTESLADVIAFYRFADVFPAASIDGVRETIRYGSPIGAFAARAWGLDVRIEAIAQDANAISLDEAAGSGLRGRDFFRLLREVELLSGTPKMPPLFSGRTAFGGGAGNFQLAQGPLARSIYEASVVNTHEEVLSWWASGAGVSARGALTRPSGFLDEFMRDHSIAWKHLDQSLGSWILFFHEIPPRP